MTHYAERHAALALQGLLFTAFAVAAVVGLAPLASRARVVLSVAFPVLVVIGLAGIAVLVLYGTVQTVLGG